jgi:putative transposase
VRVKQRYDVRAYIVPLRRFALNEQTERALLSQLMREYIAAVNFAIGGIWEHVRWSTRWVYRPIVSSNTFRRLPPEAQRSLKWRSYVKLLIPHLPRGEELRCLQKTIRCRLLEDWGWSKHYVDGALRDSHGILESWHSNYMNGTRKPRRPKVRRKFVRVKKTMMHFDRGVLRVSVKPMSFLYFDLRKACWWLPRAREFLGRPLSDISDLSGADLGEVLITEEKLIVTVRRRRHHNVGRQLVVGWDNNLPSVDGFSSSSGFDSVSLRRAYTLRAACQNKRRRIQRRFFKKRKRVYSRLIEKYRGRERNRVNNELHGVANLIVGRYPGYIHLFEDTEKQGMYSRSRRRNRDISTVNWKQLAELVGYKSAGVGTVPAPGTTKRCPRCGAWNRMPKSGSVVTCWRCGLQRERQRGASLNIFLRGVWLAPHQTRRTMKLLKRLRLISRWKVELRRA